MGDAPRIVIALVGALAFAALAVATFAALRGENLRRVMTRELKRKQATEDRSSVACRRVHASDVAALWLARERQEEPPPAEALPPLEAEDLPFFRAARPAREPNEEEVNPLLNAPPKPRSKAP